MWSETYAIFYKVHHESIWLPKVDTKLFIKVRYEVQGETYTDFLL